MSDSTNVSRRDFVKTGALGAAAALTVPAILASSAQAEEKKAAGHPPLKMGFIGIGKMGDSHITRFIGYRETLITAVCDVDTFRRERARKFVDDKNAEIERKDARPCKAYKHYKELLADKDIDIVLIAVPDHWHTTIAMEACKAGKDIYCEKPLTLTIDEAKRLIDCVRKYDRVFQVGSQQRTEGPFADAVDMIHAGRLGKIKEVRVGLSGATSKVCGLFPEDPDPGLDWNEWQGQAPARPYNHILCQKGDPGHYPFNPGWRDYREYSGGYITDWGAHHCDITQWALFMDNSGPVEIRPPKRPGDLYGVEYVYRGSPAGDEIVVKHLETIYEYERTDKEGKKSTERKSNGILFIGEKGKMFVDRGTLVSEPDNIVKSPLSESEKKVPRVDGKGMTPHHRNWLDCIRTRQRPICDVEIGARSVTVAHLINLAYWHDATLYWDPQKWEFTGDNAKYANELRTRPQRKGFELPML